METIRKLTFNNRNNTPLSARFDVPVDGHINATAIFAHCFTCSKNLRAVRQVVTGLNRQGIAVLSFDFTGIGQSHGAFAETNFTSNIEDLIDAANYVEEHYRAPQLLVGHSLGGAAVIAASAHLESVKAVATIGAPSTPSHLTHLFEDIEEDIEHKGYGKVVLGGQSFEITEQFVRDLNQNDIKETLGRFKRALLVMHAPLDEVVSVNNATEIFLAAKHPKSFVSLDKADHLLSEEEDAIYAGEVIGQWASKYIDRHDHDQLAQNAQVVTRTGPDGYHTDIRAGRHGMIADEPKSVGGHDHGPTPYDLLLASLGACTSMTLRMYADRKKWPLQSVIVRLNHKKQHTVDCQRCGEDGAKLDHIDKRIELIGDLDDAQRQRLLQIAERCPVNRTLNKEVVMTLSLDDGDA